ncbi:sensor histidine kinase [Oscillospiraceae bacterium LCP25S3_E10]|nr:HAMP domain-containing histidine kinase [Ruminococcus sp.]MDD6446437.1 HAMP domain-containing sensor histidine kinase [Ruminococcus sp.]
MLPRQFEKEAGEALVDQINFINSMNDYNDTDDSEDDTVEILEYPTSFFSSYIYYIYINDDINESEDNVIISRTPSSSTKSIAELKKYYNENNLNEGEIYTLQTDNGYYVLTWINEENSDYDYNVLMYINIYHLVEYARSLTFVVLAVFFCILIIMTIIGYRLGIQIERSQEIQQRFFQNSSHELKTPLMAIQGYAEGIKMGVVDPEDSADVIMMESDRMTSLVEEILLVSKIDAHYFKLNFAVLDIREVLYDCLSSLEATQRMKGVEIIPKFCDKPMNVKCDEYQMVRAFRNIVANGLKHCKNKITVICQPESKKVSIRFVDDGSGVEKKDLPHIFDRFYKGSNGGTGIGLSLAAEIIHMHNGKIIAYNSIDGAVFEVILPIVRR